MSSLFITFEGIEHCGKTTQADLLARRLTDAGRTVTSTQEPGGTPLGRSIRRLLLDASETVDTVAELLLFAADRAHHVRTLIRPALEAGHVVISDRYTDSTRAYQGHGRGIDADLIERVISVATDDLAPDLTILIDVDVATSRSRGAPVGDDRIEQEADAFFDRVRSGFRTIAAAAPDRVVVLDGSGSIEETAAAVAAAVDARLKS